MKCRNPFDKAYTVESVGNSKFRLTDMINKRTVSNLADWLEAHVRSILGNRSQAESTYKD